MRGQAAPVREAPPLAPAHVRRRPARAPRLEGLVDLVRAALSVALWNWRDRRRKFSFAVKPVARLAPSVLRLPAREGAGSSR